ncbi:MAG: nucleotidyltransferase family protein [Pseudomonadota bacterium]
MRLLVACLSTGPADDGAIAGLAAGLRPGDWDAFARLAITHHRVAPLVLPRLEGTALPDPVRAQLAQSVHRNAVQALVQVVETGAMRAALEQAGIALGVLKGWPLAERLYGSVGGRHAGDLDLLVPEARVEAACAALGALGYGPDRSTPKMRRRARGLGDPGLVKAAKDIALSHPDKTLTVELHWQLLNYHGWPALLDRPGALIRQESQAGPLLVPEPATDLIYLSAHGSLHLWGRLKWLADIAAFARAAGPEALGAHWAAAERLGVARPMALALGLAARLFGTPLPPGMARETGLERWILARLGRTDRPPTDGPAYQIGLRWMGLRLAQGWRQKLGIVGYDTTRRLRLIRLDMRLRRGSGMGAESR